MTVKGHDLFYDGWLNRVLLQPDSIDMPEDWRHGWRIADETGDDAISVLQCEIRKGRIIVDLF